MIPFIQQLDSAIEPSFELPGAPSLTRRPRAPARGHASEAAERPVITGARFVVAELERRGIETVVGIPGGAILPLYDALYGSRVRHVLARHEQGAAFIAQGMARATGTTAVCLATSGPGATNLITALADARADSIPILAITAQVPRGLIGTDAFQEVDTCALARPVTKACFFASSAAELARLLPRAFELTVQGRPGPVLIDIPKDVLTEALPNVADEDGDEAELEPHPRSRPARVGRWLDARQDDSWREIGDWLAASERPLLYIGGGIHAARAHAELLSLATRADIPVVSSLHGLGAFPADDPRFLGMLGMHGAPHTNHATEEADLVLAIGARFDDRATGRPEAFCRNARIVHIDVDPREIGKIKPADLGVVADARLALTALLGHVAVSVRPRWRRRLRALEAEHPLVLPGQACALLTRLGAALDRRTLVTTDVGQHQMWVAQCLKFREPRTLLTSGGLGTMGFGLPAAIGAALTAPSGPVICVSGDGSFMMNLQELATLAELGLDVIVFVLNNAQLGLVRQQQQLFYGQRYSAAHFEQRSDFAALAQAFGVRGLCACAEELTSDRLREIIALGGPSVVDVQLAEHENVLPMVPPGASNLEMIVHAAEAEEGPRGPALEHRSGSEAKASP